VAIVPKAKKPAKASKPKPQPDSATSPRADECLLGARYEPSSSSLELRFADDRSFTLPISRLEMPLDRIRWPTATASPDGESLIVVGIKGDPIPIAATTLRFLVDESYAKRINEEVASVQLSRNELHEIARTSVRRDATRPEPDLRRASWK
jgi:hypothetical protein